MDAVKPLIFIHPLSPTLKKLKEVSEENAEADGVEIYEIDDINEFNQLFPTVGQSLCLFSDPKKCAKALQTNKKTMQKIHSKIILISPKKIPPKTLEKFDKVGLTECITEPVAPKTLMYKVKLQLRSIKSQSADDDEDEEKKFSKDEKSEVESEDSYYRGKKDKKELEEEESIDYRQRYEKKEDNEEDNEEDAGSHGDSQESHWKGKVNQEEELDKEKEKKEKYKEEAIDTHYKGKSKKTDLDIDDDLYKKDKKENDLEDDDEFDDIKKSLALEIEEEGHSYNKDKAEEEDPFEERKKDKSLDLEFEKDDKKKKSNPDHMQSHMKGKLSETSQKEDHDAHESERDHLEDDKMRGELEGPGPEEDEGNIGSRGNKNLDISSEEDSKKSKSNYEEIDGKLKHDGEAIHDDNSPLSDEQKRKSKNIEKYIKGSLSHLEEEQEEDDLIDNEKQLDLESSPEEADPNIGVDEEEQEERKKDKKLALDKEEDLKKTRSKEEEEEKEKQRADRTSSSSSKPTDNETEKKKREEEKDYNKTSSNGLIEEDTESERQRAEKEESEKKSNRRDGYSSNEGKTKEAQRADNRADQIKKHYKGKGNKHEEQGWGNLHQRQAKQDEDFGERKSDQNGQESYDDLKKDHSSKEEEIDNEKEDGPSYSIDQKESKNAGELHYANDELGEQTIDYEKLKDEYESIPYDLKSKVKISTEYEGSDKSQNGVSITEGKKSSSPVEQDGEQSTHIGLDSSLEELDQEGSTNEAGEEDTVYEPFPCGLDEVIQIQSFYSDNTTKIDQLLIHIAQKIHELQSGLTTFYSYKKGIKEPVLMLCPFEDIVPSQKDSETHEIWEELKGIKLPFWQQMKLPAWSDKTFQDKELDFYYPYYENGELMGFAVVYFTKGYRESRIGALEVILESARGFYSEHYHPSGLTEKGHTPATQNKVTEKRPEQETKKEKGLLGKFFGKKAS